MHPSIKRAIQHATKVYPQYADTIKSYTYKFIPHKARWHGLHNPSTKEIIINSLYKRTDLEYYETTLHEIAHAIDHIQRGGSRHDNKWRAIYINLGGSGKTHSEGRDNAPWMYVMYEEVTKEFVQGYHRKPRNRVLGLQKDLRLKNNKDAKIILCTGDKWRKLKNA